MKVRLPKHREFLIKFEDGYDKADEAWEALNQIVLFRRRQIHLFGNLY